MEGQRIEMRHIVKVFPPDNVALNDVSFSTGHGEIHSIIGENGAGKSTLMKILYGLESAGEGEIYLDGEKRSISSPKDAVAYGIGMVHQEFMLIGEYSVIENIVLGNEPVGFGGIIQIEKARGKLEAIIEKFQFDINLDEKVNNISIAAQQKVEIIKLLYRDVDTLIMDEPTAVLAPQEVDELFELLETIKKEGKTILFISHRLDEVLRISDYITVLRSGRFIWTKENKGLTKTDLAQAMVGRDVVLTVQKEPVEPGAVILDVRDLCVKNPRVESKKDVYDTSFTIREKEIVGIAGIEGNGQYELLQALMGLAPSEGSIFLDGQDLTGMGIRERRRWISYVAQDRKISGSSQTDSIEQNLVMTHHYRNKALLGRFHIFGGKRCGRFSRNLIEKYQIVCAGAKAPIQSLSGGNQQKVIIGREFELDSKLLVLDQPVRGIDVGSIEYIHKKIIEMRNAGLACLLVSADLDELFSLADWILVMYRGRIVARKRPEETTREEIGEYMLGVRADDAVCDEMR